MYSYEDRMKAVKLFIKYDLSITDTLRVLGYPQPQALLLWYQEYQKAGKLHKKFIKQSKYSIKQKKVAVIIILNMKRVFRER